MTCGPARDCVDYLTDIVQAATKATGREPRSADEPIRHPQRRGHPEHF
jgi:hypothetical protein